MPSLLGLPLELLMQIVQETIPVDFEATSLSCKTLFAASTPFRAQYATRRKRFRSFTFSRKFEEKPEGAEESDSGEYWDEITQETGIRIMTTRQLLEHIALDQSVAKYIQYIDLRAFTDADEEEEEEEDVINSLEAEVPETLRSLVLTSPFIEAVKGDVDDWIKGIRWSPIYADVFLLTLLSQVRKLTLHPNWDELDPLSTPHMWPGTNEPLWSVLKLITHRANRPEEFPDAPLSLLSALQPSRDIGYEEKSPLTPFVPFLSINSVSEVSLRSCVLKDDGYTGIAFDPMIGCYSKNLRKLTLESSVAGPEELSQLLTRIPNLEIFEFSHETKWHGCGYHWNIGAFLDTVQIICAKTLKKLSVTLLDHRASNGATLVDMTRFQKLAVLELDVDMLCFPAYDPSMRDLEWDEFESVGSPAWPRLTDMLPTSIESFSLYLNTFSGHHLRCISHLIEGLSGARATRLSHLNKLCLFVRLDSHSMIPDVALKELNAAKNSGFSIVRFGTSTSIL
ncbi:hypothetical protein N7491_011265 [Penicillium cf. griseofulvum]|uniref:F-box domain-containing protein n=1 Tax=Penicillium cf. griseofulvum TaxID=2972120 RepID=A0A9W9JP73_9EURO|nr:hypothetical protein N7472_004731 [Penicillium cf. griseofulvum]KAJ5416363.1 hypothetical protein N7491_011265 [Penicillium cf. griseofulvum]KAJ5442300.1 hypothetical protein N7445_005307 [Penicillium cf. griseofulvum]